MENHAKGVALQWIIFFKTRNVVLRHLDRLVGVEALLWTASLLIHHSIPGAVQKLG
jgi:hypothetical protein